MGKTGVIALIIVVQILAGCTPKKTTSMVSSTVENVAPPVNEEGEVDMLQCEKELGALASVNQPVYQSLKTRFDRVMYAASGYTNVRNSVNPETRNAIDSLYKFQAVKLCVEIRSEMLNGLADKPIGEKSK